MKGLVLQEFPREETVGESGFFSRSARGQRVGEPLAPVRPHTLAHFDEPSFGSRSQLRVEPPEGDPDGRCDVPLRRFRRQVDLAQKVKQGTFLIGNRFCTRCGHDERLKVCSRMNALHG
ncbi:hypothetical protein CSE45_0457 [Citreicella sp. SE45]|nr:hypothetical protein CSE45_0457 [Citreicella sp. SE45]